MNCKDVRDLLVAYLDDELTPSEQKLLQFHLTECAACQSEMAALWKTQSHVGRFLKAGAAQVGPSPQAWGRLRAQLAVQAQTPAFSLTGTLRRLGIFQTSEDNSSGGAKRSFLLDAYSMGFVALAVLVFVGLLIVLPLIRGPQGEGVFASAPSRESSISEPGQAIDGSAANVPVALIKFTPLSPLQRPVELTNVAVIDDSLNAPRHEIDYYSDEQFLTVSQTPVTGNDVLPMGQSVEVGGLPGVLETGLAGTVELEGGKVSIAYTDALRLTWLSNGVHVKILSNLPQDRVLSFAEALALTFAPFVPGFQPATFYASSGVVWVEHGLMVTRDVCYGNEQFVTLTQTHITSDADLPTGDLVTVNGQPGVLVKGLAGVAQITGDPIQDDPDRVMVGGGGGSGEGGSASGPQLYPDTIPYSDGYLLVWTMGEVRLEMLSNLPEGELFKFAEALVPGQEPEPDLSDFQLADLSVTLPNGEALVGYEVGELEPQLDYALRALLVFDGNELIHEMRWYFGDDQFMILTVRNAAGIGLPDGTPASVGGAPAVLRTTLTGTALLTTEIALQDGQEYLALQSYWGASGTLATLPLPDAVPYYEGKQLVWMLDGAYLELLTNLPDTELYRFAEAITVTKMYYFVHPNAAWVQGAFQTPGYVPLVPSYIPPDLFTVADAGAGQRFELVYHNYDGDQRFVLLTQRQARPGEGLPAGQAIIVNGIPAVLETGLQGTYDLPLGSGVEILSFVYSDAVRITMVLNDTWVQLLVNYSLDEAVKVVEGLNLAE